MGFLKTYLGNNQGASSILIMIMMIILMVFGLAALTTSSASRKLAQKNASWLKDYYALEGQAQIAYGHLVEALDLEEAGLDVDQVEKSLVALAGQESKVSWQKREDLESPFVITIEVRQEHKEAPKSIIMEFGLEKNGSKFELRTQKWAQVQADIFDPHDQIHFSDIHID